MKLTRADIVQGARRAESLKARMANLRKKTEKVTERAVHTVEVGASAFGFGVLRGRSEDPNEGVQLFGIPVELLAGLGFHGAGFLGLGGKMSSHLHGFGDGALAAYAVHMGTSIGHKWKKDGGTGLLEGGDTLKRVGKGASAFSHQEAGDAVLEAAAAGR